MNMFSKFKYVLTTVEKRKIGILLIGSILLSISEVFSVGVVIPLTTLFVEPERLASTDLYRQFCDLSGITDINAIFRLLVIVAIALFVLKSLYAVFMIFMNEDFARKVYNRITTTVLRSYLQRPYTFHLENNSAVLFKNITSEAAQFRSGLLLPILVICSETIIILGILTLLLLAYPKVTLIIVAAFASIFSLVYLLQKNSLKRYSIQREQSHGEFFKSGIEALNGVKEIKIYNVKKLFLERFADGIWKYTSSIVKYTVTASAPRYLMECLLFVGILVSLALSFQNQTGRAEIFPVIAAFGVAAVRVLPSSAKIYAGINSISYYHNSLDIIFRILHDDAEQTVPAGNIADQALIGSASMPVSARTGTIVLKDVTFQFQSAPKPIFEDLDFVIPAKKTVALVGLTGAGKSTLIDIIVGLLVPSSGALVFNGVRITSENIAAYRRQIGYVPQQIFLSDDSLAANVAFGIEAGEVDETWLHQAIELAHLGDFVAALPEGLQTRIGEKGVKISGGQRQRIGIARALYRRPDILILDEATSSLDGFTEAELTRDIKSMGGNLTIVIVAHRLRTIEHADIIHVMDEGRVVDQGTYTHLMANSAHFQKIAQQQTAAQETAGAPATASS